MRFIIVGAGAIGGSIGGLLARHDGNEVVLVARGEHGLAIAEHGLRVETPGESFTVRPTVVAAIAQLAYRAGDVVMIAVKSQDANTALLELAAVMPIDTPVVCLTNGVYVESVALRHFVRVYGVCVHSPASFMRPGVVQAWGTGSAGALEVGCYPDGVDEIAGQLAVSLGHAGFVSHARSDVMRWKRDKLLSNLGNAVQALCGDGEVQREINQRARAEGIACFVAAGLARLSDDERAAQRSAYGVGTIGGVSRSGGSTWQSLARGRTTTEADYLNGEIAMLGRLHGVATPVNVGLQREMNAAARIGAEPGSMPARELHARLAIC